MSVLIKDLQRSGVHVCANKGLSAICQSALQSSLGAQVSFNLPQPKNLSARSSVPTPRTESSRSYIIETAPLFFAKDLNIVKFPHRMPTSENTSPMKIRVMLDVPVCSE